MIQLTSKGSWKKTQSWLSKVAMPNLYKNKLHKYGKLGVEALKNNTPVLTGVTADSWYYEIEKEKRGVYKIVWANSNMAEEWYNVALFIQLGHATAAGTWVEGIDYINPALAPIFNEIAEQVWDEFSQNPK